MLTRIDRVQMAVPDKEVAAQQWVGLLGATHEHEDRVDSLGALRSTYRLGSGRIELLEPDGAGAVADAVARHGGHLFAAGAATLDVERFAAHLRSQGSEAAIENGQIHLDEAATGGWGLRLVVSSFDVLPEVGVVDHLYEVTNLVPDAPTAVAHYAELFGLSTAPFEPIESKHYGYSGTLTLFEPDNLDRFEVITPNDSDKTMGRFFGKQGPSLYMAFGECGELSWVESYLKDRELGHTAEPAPAKRDGKDPHTVFIHPAVLGGMMLGLSRPNLAWLWSGHPERVEGER